MNRDRHRLAPPVSDLACDGLSASMRRAEGGRRISEVGGRRSVIGRRKAEWGRMKFANAKLGLRKAEVCKMGKSEVETRNRSRGLMNENWNAELGVRSTRMLK